MVCRRHKSLQVCKSASLQSASVAHRFYRRPFLPSFSFPVQMYLVRRLNPRSKVNIKEKFVFITGCDSGFGRETAIRLDEMGACVFATCLTKEGGQSLKSVTSDKLKIFQMDVTNSQQIKEVYREVKQQIPRDTGLWGLVNNAGIVHLLPIEWAPLDLFKRIADVNLWGMVDVTKTFLPLVKNAQGRVVNFSSVAGRLCPDLKGPYGISKYGVEAFSDALRREMRPWGIKVSIMEPGGFQTPNADPKNVFGTLMQGWNDLTDELKEEYKEKGIRLHGFTGASRHTYKVVDAVVDALTSQSPRDRYLVGLDARLFYVVMARLPTVVSDFILRWTSYRLPLPLPEEKN